MASLEKKPRFVSKKLQASARGEECTLQIPFAVCNFDWQTTALCHIPDDSGTGKEGGKTDDHPTAIYACSGCHDWLDRRAHRHVWSRDADRAKHILNAVIRTQRRMRERELIKVPK